MKRILVIDDDWAIGQIVQISLKAIAGWEVIVATSGQDGIDKALIEHPDAILLDMMMPGMDGVTTLKVMRSHSVFESLPIILLTAKAQIHEKQQFSELPINGMITKPFTAPDLVKQMRSLLNWNE
ncbi:Response regulator receiver protein [Planktothrix serta PCC 8927]|uniref:Response regulator receiver protein n=1 Tax=Planktothrix serta PCC 8927 TaxID=671068 RepID=A0A7Z9BV27_9CYAN|nr:response regulator [Planktothrix serta]VXD23082.1 Response regulator receiver protein [Planktothrix serta PCC 8927]